MRAAYLASRFSRGAELRGYAEQLATINIQTTSRWLSETENGEGFDSTTMIIAVRDRNDIERADALIGFTEPPRSTTSRGGRHVETGIALGLGKRVIIVGPRENVFHTLPEIEGPFVSFAELFEVLKNEVAKNHPAHLVRPPYRNGHDRAGRA